MTTEIKEVVVRFTNQKGMDSVEKKRLKGISVDDWKMLTMKEFDNYLAIIIVMGVNHDTKISVQDLWKTESFFFTPKYSRFMSRNRFQAILSCLRFDDSKTRDVRKESNRLAAISEVTELFRTACVSNFNTSENVTIDERIVPFTGNCRFRVYVKNKPDKYGIKIWVMSCSESFYMKNYDIYLGKIDTREKNQGERVVLQLSSCLSHGYNITVDNFFTSFSLASKLLKKNITLLGTLRQNKKEIPKELLPSKERIVFSSEFRFSDDYSLVSYVPKKKKAVILLSSSYPDKRVSMETKRKPQMILEYNKTKHAVDSLDKMTKQYSTKRANRRWTMTLFSNFLDISLLNAYVVFCEKHKNEKLPSRKQLYLDLAECILSHNEEKEPICVPANPEKPKNKRCQNCPKGKRPRHASAYCSNCNRTVCPDHFVKTIVCNECLSLKSRRN